MLLAMFHACSSVVCVLRAWYHFNVQLLHSIIPFYHHGWTVARNNACEALWIWRHQIWHLASAECRKLILHFLFIYQYAIVFFITGLVAFQVFSDYNFNFFQLLAVNSFTTKSSNLPVLYFTYFLIFVVMLTAFGDYLIFKKNKELKNKVRR